ncbi:MAG: hypothetical protein ACHBN1_05400 [Heteroscytonema crispum UTEX LB 1556]
MKGFWIVEMLQIPPNPRGLGYCRGRYGGWRPLTRGGKGAKWIFLPLYCRGHGDSVMLQR